MANCCEPGNPLPEISIDEVGASRPLVAVAEGSFTLDVLPIGKSAVVSEVGGEGALRQHFLDMGLTPGVSVTMVKHAPMGDPVQVHVHGYELSLRVEDAKRIGIAQVNDRPDTGSEAGLGMPVRNGVFPGGHPHETEHPGLGEGGRYHDSSSGQPLLEGETLTLALVGNHNSGKTALFNQLTGENLHVGNFPGVTVDRNEAPLRNHPNARAIDLPGMNALTPFSTEELVARQAVLDSKLSGIISVVDSTNIERNLYLTMQLLELDIPMVVALNMMDELAANGGSVLVNELESQLGVAVVPISAQTGEGVAELVDHALHVARFRERPVPQDYCDATGEGAAIHRCLHGVMHLVEDHAQRAGMSVRFAAAKLVEGDALVQKALDLDQNEQEAIEHLIAQMETESGLDRAAAMAAMRFAFIDRVCAATVIKPQESKEHAFSARVDRILTGRFTAIPVFALIMLAVFGLTFGVVGAWLQDLLAQGIDALSGVVATAMEEASVNVVVQSLIIDGIFGGVGSILSFLPIIVVLFFFLSLLEDSGYMARVAFVMDKPLRKLGLSGRSIVPMLIGFGCSVPAVMAARTLASERDRKLTILLTPFMSCSAKLPVYVFLAAAFFPDHVGLVVASLYVLGIFMAILAAAILKRTVFRGGAGPFVMELPNYRMPAPKNVAHLLWDKSYDFLQRAFTVILVAAIVIWAMQTFSVTLNVVEDSSESILALVASWIAPAFAPLGLDDWRICTALIAGFSSKETVIMVLGVLYSGAADLALSFTPLAGVCLLVFCLLYTPCVAAIASINRELGWKWALGVVFGQCLVAWVVAFAVRCVGLIMGFV